MLSGLRRVTSREADRIASLLEVYLETRNDHVNNTNSVVRGISDWMGDVDVPSQMRFIIPKARAEAAKQALDELEFTGDPRALETIQAPMYEDKVVDFILEMARIEDKSVSAKELMGQEDQAVVWWQAGLQGREGIQDASGHVYGKHLAPFIRAAIPAVPFAYPEQRASRIFRLSFKVCTV
ncbi:MAG: hypothetical protein EOM24_35580 [Chloroflexia bacterium]|nr:hypothetical protein [Chloroflexia bacterium]